MSLDEGDGWRDSPFDQGVLKTGPQLTSDDALFVSGHRVKELVPISATAQAHRDTSGSPALLLWAPDRPV